MPIGENICNAPPSFGPSASAERAGTPAESKVSVTLRLYVSDGASGETRICAAEFAPYPIHGGRSAAIHGKSRPERSTNHCSLPKGDPLTRRPISGSLSVEGASPSPLKLSDNNWPSAAILSVRLGSTGAGPTVGARCE